MKDWKQIASALAPDIPSDAVDRIVPTLNALESAFRPLLEQLTLDLETSYVQMVEPEQEA